VRLSINNHTLTSREPLPLGEYRIRDERRGPDGFLCAIGPVLDAVARTTAQEQARAAAHV